MAQISDQQILLDPGRARMWLGRLRWLDAGAKCSARAAGTRRSRRRTEKNGQHFAKPPALF